jgi:hypothetical protein
MSILEKNPNTYFGGEGPGQDGNLGKAMSTKEQKVTPQAKFTYLSWNISLIDYILLLYPTMPVSHFLLQSSAKIPYPHSDVTIVQKKFLFSTNDDIICIRRETKTTCCAIFDSLRDHRVVTLKSRFPII